VSLRDKTTDALEWELWAIQNELDLRRDPLGQMVIEIESLPGVLSATWEWDIDVRGRSLSVRVLADWRRSSDTQAYDIAGIVAHRSPENVVTVRYEPESDVMFPGRFLDW
jgi:hypothetical protein